MDKRLEEQLERMRRLSNQVGQIHERLAENTELLMRDRTRVANSSWGDGRQHSSTPKRRPSTRSPGVGRSRQRRPL
ncbi:MAG TPA: hypothetical protein VM032_08170 [Vicinamibacterales bacterium]|nr:hypothetical protein [Vicinamibacterales bacterium]